MKKVKQWLCLLLAAFAVSGAVAGMLVLREQQAIAQKLVRLHVRANSDTEEDQEVKLQVRDAVLQQVQTVTADCSDSQEAICVLADHLPALAQTASETLRNLGKPNAVRVSLCEETFPTRNYDTFSLPAGNYVALRVDIGAAEGHNWWCVVFPTLCMSATTDGMEEAAQAAGFSEEELELLTEDTPKVQIKFRILEFFSDLFHGAP